MEETSSWWDKLKRPPIEPPATTNLDYALKYAAMGWRVLPCYHIVNGACSCNNHECHSPGKHPMIAGGATSATTDAEKITEWFTKWPNANIAIATGRESGFFAVDVDINHALGKYGDKSQDELRGQGKVIDSSVIALTGGGGKHYLYKYPANVDILCSTSKIGANIDVRGKGGYIMVEPSNHLLGHYIFESSSDPLNGDAKLEDAPQWLIAITSAKEKGVVKKDSGMYFASSEWDVLPEDQKQDILTALEYCPNFTRDDWRIIGMAIHSMDSSATGLEIWENWSKTCDKFDAEDQARVWSSFNNNKKDKLNKESIFFIARKNGYKSELEKQKTEQTTKQANEIVNAINHSVIVETEQPAPHTYPPVNNLFPVNVLNRLAGFINAGSSCYSDAATTQAVIAAASLLASRRYLTPQDDSVHLYIGISSGSIGSIGELRYTSRGVRQILQQCGLIRMVRDSRFSSVPSLYKSLSAAPAQVYLCDDYSAMIKLCQRQTTGGIEMVLNTLTRVYDDKFIQFESDDVGVIKNLNYVDGKFLIVRPSVTMLSLMHYSQLATFAKVSELGRGSVEQYIFSICDNDDLVFKEEQPVVLPDDVIDLLLNVRGIKREDEGDMKLETIFNELISVPPEFITVQFAEPMTSYDAMIDDITHDRRHRIFKNGARKNMRRLMSILAAFDNPLHPVATRSIMQWSADYVAANLARLIEVLNVVVSDDGKADIGQLVLDAIIKHGPIGIQPWNLVNYCRPYKALSKEKRQELIDKMLDDKDIVTIKFKEISGKESGRLVYSKFHTEKQG